MAYHANSEQMFPKNRDSIKQPQEKKQEEITQHERDIGMI